MGIGTAAGMSRGRLKVAAGIACVALAAVSFGSLGTATALAVKAGVSPLLFATVRAAGGAAILLILSAAMGERASLPRGERLSFAVLVGAGVAVAVGLTTAYSMAPVALVSGVFYLYPALVALIASRLREERLGWAGLAGVAAIVAGVLLLAAGQAGAGAAVAPAGVALAAMAAVSQAAYFRAGARVRSMPPFMLAGAILAAGAAVTLPAAILTGGAGTLDVVSRPAAAAPLLWSATVTAALAMTALLVGIRLVGPTRSAVVMLGEPVTNALAGAAILGQPLPPQALGGIALLLAGAARVVSRKAPAAEFDAPAGSAAGVLPFAD